MSEARISQLFDLAGQIAPARETQLRMRIDTKSRFDYIAGSPVVFQHPTQRTNSIEQIYKDAEEATAEYESMIRDLARKIGNGSRSVSFAIIPDKHVGRTVVKGREDYDGAFDHVLDIKRSSIYISTANEQERAERLLTPANNSAVVRLHDGIGFPDESGKPRRMLASLEMSNGHIGECQIRLLGMEKAYKRTSGIYQHIRATEGCLKHNNIDPDTRQFLLKKVATWQGERDRIHTQAEHKSGADKLVKQIRFCYVDGVPVAQIHRPISKEYEALIPDPATGKFARDNRFLSMLEDPARAVQLDVPEIAFRARCAALVQPGIPQLRANIYTM